MKSTESFKKALSDIEADRQIGRAAAALSKVDALLREWPDNPYLLTLRGELIQLQEDSASPELDDARTALVRATELDPESPIPAMELAYYLFAVEDDSRAALKYFDAAVGICKRILKEARVGRAGANAELRRRTRAPARATPARNTKTSSRG